MYVMRAHEKIITSRIPFSHLDFYKTTSQNSLLPFWTGYEPKASDALRTVYCKCFAYVVFLSYRIESYPLLWAKSSFLGCSAIASTRAKSSVLGCSAIVSTSVSVLIHQLFNWKWPVADSRKSHRETRSRDRTPRRSVSFSASTSRDHDNYESDQSAPTC